LTRGEWTHDHPLDVETLTRLGLPVNTDMPLEVEEYMRLFPQPATGRPSVQYIPLPYRGPTPLPRPSLPKTAPESRPGASVSTGQQARSCDGLGWRRHAHDAGDWDAAERDHGTAHDLCERHLGQGSVLARKGDQHVTRGRDEEVAGMTQAGGQGD